MAPTNPEPIKIAFRPGINRESTDYGNSGGWWDCNLARVQDGNWRSMGGWQKFSASAITGVGRTLFAWSDLEGTQFYSTGTERKYYVFRGNEPLDITPLRKTTDPMANDPFTTDAAGSPLVTVTDTAHGAVLGDYVTFSGVTGPIDGIPADDFNKEHTVTEVIDANTYTITVATNATTGGVAGGGAAAIAEYQVNIGLDTSVLGSGWGAGPWGENGWGEAVDVVIPSTQLRIWTQDNYGENLLTCVRDGAIYLKNINSVQDRMTNLATEYPGGNVPTIARQIMVADNSRHVIAFGCNTIGSAVQDRLLARWSASENLGEWMPDTTNSAGSLRFDSGSEFIQAVETVTEIMVFTNVSLHSMRYIGAPYTYGQTKVGTNIHLASPMAAVSTGAEVYWMGTNLFQMYDGVVRDLPCSIRTYVFSILNYDQILKVVAGTNRANKEVIWLMPVNGSTENNFYVVCNYENPGNPSWYYGSFNGAGRTAWLDAFFQQYPMAMAPDGYVYTHDYGALDGSVSPGTGLNSYVKSSVFEIGNGGYVMHISRIIPDLTFGGSSATTPSVNITLARRDWPGSTFVEEPDMPVTRSVALPVEQFTSKIDKKFRARSIQIGIETDEAGTLWELGVPRIYASPDGLR